MNVGSWGMSLVEVREAVLKKGLLELVWRRRLPLASVMVLVGAAPFAGNGGPRRST